MHLPIFSLLKFVEFKFANKTVWQKLGWGQFDNFAEFCLLILAMGQASPLSLTLEASV